MLRRFSLGFALLSILLDAVLVAISLHASALIRPSLNPLAFIAYLPGPVELPGLVYMLAPLVFVGVFLLLGLYDGRKNYRVVDELSLLLLGSILAGVSLAGVLYLSYREVSRALYLVFWGIAVGLLVAWRLAARAYFRYQAAQAVTRRRVLIVGDGELAQTVAEQVHAYANLGWDLVGFLSDQTALAGAEPVLGAVSQARWVVQEQRIDDVLIAQPKGTHETTNRLVAELNDLPVKIWAVPDYFSLSLQRAHYQNFAGMAMLDLSMPALTEYQRLVKRAVDLVLGTLFLIPGSVLMLLISLAIRLESRGPAIFKQARIGENGQLFFMYKFRTMVAGAEEMRHLVEETDAQGNLIHKHEDDPRVTRVGRFLRRTSWKSYHN